jgi:plasmid replication initiation protein
MVMEATRIHTLRQVCSRGHQVHHYLKSNEHLAATPGMKAKPRLAAVAATMAATRRQVEEACLCACACAFAREAMSTKESD